MPDQDPQTPAEDQTAQHEPGKSPQGSPPGVPSDGSDPSAAQDGDDAATTEYRDALKDAPDMPGPAV
ncbi:hypothetical protein [Phenylobacterium deserti]|uniref:Uncharacterized protein n=1 Tax=Phenylobacterium deserti TaxID=1914756 RepID=A0A328AUR9_9CAUL|nr:hypothetical protein [Phenylobacterium deserti]RAK57284.1 hypothetical protein DJ018_04875 [Phenylobacterium deserti]